MHANSDFWRACFGANGFELIPAFSIVDPGIDAMHSNLTAGLLKGAKLMAELSKPIFRRPFFLFAIRRTCARVTALREE